MNENLCFLLKSDMHMRPKRFNVLCSPTGSPDKTQLMCSKPIDVFYYVVQVGWITVPCPKAKLSLLIIKSFAEKKQSVISVASKTPLKTRLRICIYKTSLPHRPDDYIGFASSCPLTFYNEIATITWGNTIAAFHTHTTVYSSGSQHGSTPHRGHWRDWRGLGAKLV